MTIESCGLAIKHINDALARRSNAQLKSHNVTLSQIAVLHALSTRPNAEATFKELERTLRVSQPTTVGLIARLQEKGLVETCVSTDDLRVKIARLTAEGCALEAEARVDMEREEAALLAGFSREEKKQFHQFLERVQENVE